jgi:hypothetical protein
MSATGRGAPVGRGHRFGYPADVQLVVGVTRPLRVPRGPLSGLPGDGGGEEEDDRRCGADVHPTPAVNGGYQVDDDGHDAQLEGHRGDHVRALWLDGRATARRAAGVVGGAG